MALVFISKSALRERIPSNFDVDGSELVPAEVTRIEIPAGGAHDCSGETGSARNGGLEGSCRTRHGRPPCHRSVQDPPLRTALDVDGTPAKAPAAGREAPAVRTGSERGGVDFSLRP